MSAFLLLLTLGAGPAAAEREDPELAVEEAKAIRRELITVRAELRRLKAREESLKVRKTLGLTDAEAQERLRKDPLFLRNDAEIRELQKKIAEIERVAKPEAVREMVKSLNDQLKVRMVTQEEYVRVATRENQEGQYAEQQAYYQALERILLADLKRLTGR